MKVKKWLLVLVLSLSLFASPSFAAKYNWRLANEEIAGSVSDLYAQEFARLLKEKSGGEIQLDLFPSGTLGTPTEMFELTLNGAVEFCLIGPGQCSAIVPENQVLLLQFLFSSDEDKNERFLATSRSLNEKLNSIYESKGVKVLSFFSEGAMYWSSNTPIRNPEDFKGVKFRVMPSELLVDVYKAYGASPVPLSFTEVYSALQLKMLDGEENAPYIIQEMKFMDVQKYLIASKHNIYVMQNIVNKKFFDGLPEDIQKIVLESVAETRPYVDKVQRELNAKRLNMMLKEFKDGQELIQLTPESFNAFREVAKGADEKYYELSRNPEFARDLLKTLREEMAEVEKQ